MKILLVYPRFPVTYWGMQHALDIVGCCATLPPLGLITLAALLPPSWELQLVDLNAGEPLTDDAIRWADAVFVGGMRIQADSIHDVVARARRLGRRTVVGGPAPTTAPSEYADADIIFQGEAEGRVPELVRALEAPARTVRIAAPSGDRPSLADVPLPRFDLLDLRRYCSAAIQTSRGCPFHCEFCDIVEIFGHRPRLKTPDQVVAELEALYVQGFRKSVFIVDDNFIGNKVAVRKLLVAIARWQRERGYPFELYTEASVNLADDDELVRAMVAAGFSSVFVGIETPSAVALASAGKRQNLDRDLAGAVQQLTAAGLEVMGGFIVGFDQDTPEAFEAQRRFISPLPIPLAMVGLLTALPGTALWRRLEREGRLRSRGDGDTFSRPNFAPAMDERELLSGYRALLAALYSPEAYYRRCEAYLDRAPPLPGGKRVELQHVLTLLRAVVSIGLLSPRRRLFWRFLWRAATRAPHSFAWAVARTAVGEHMVRYTEEQVLPRIEAALQQLEVERRAEADDLSSVVSVARQAVAAR